MQQELLQKVGDWIIKTTEQIGDFAAKEIPPFITEYLQWKFWENVMAIVQYGSAIGICTIFSIICYKVARKYKNNEDVMIPAVIGSVASAVMGFLFLIITFPTENIKNCIQIKIAPKVYLVEKAAELYKQSKQ